MTCFWCLSPMPGVTAFKSRGALGRRFCRIECREAHDNATEEQRENQMRRIAKLFRRTG